MSVVLDRVPANRSPAEVAHAVRFGQIVLLGLAAALYAVGWVCGVLWHVGKWMWVAVRLGWTDARPGKRTERRRASGVTT